MPSAAPHRLEYAVTTEFAAAAKRGGVINPMRIANVFYVILGVVNLLAGVGVVFLMTRAAQTAGIGAFGGLTVAVLLLLLGGAQIGIAMRNFRFGFLPEQIGDFDPQGRANHEAFLLDAINDGMVPQAPSPGALAGVLYGLVPNLAHAPMMVRWHAETQLARIAYLAAVTLGFALAWLFARPDIFAWLAPLYFLMAVKPLATINQIRRGVMDSDAAQPPKALTWSRIVALLLFSVVAPVLLAMAPVAIPPPPYAAATVVLPTIAALGSLLVASALFVIALIEQTRRLAASGARYLKRDDLEFADLSAGLLNRWIDALPHPLRRPFRAWHAPEAPASAGRFHGDLLCETEPQLDLDNDAASLGEAFSEAWNSDQRRPLLALGLFGCIAGIVAALAAFAFARSGAPVAGLLALALVSASQFALVSAYRLWKRADFTSTLYRLTYEGSYRTAHRVAGNSTVGSGSLTEQTYRIEHATVSICVARIGSVCFAQGGPRYLQSMDLLPDECEALFGVARDYQAKVQGRARDFYREEAGIRGLVERESTLMLGQGVDAGDAAMARQLPSEG
jgi:hypothetical protein